MEFHRRDRKRNFDKGWGVIALDPDGETEGFAIGDMLVELILLTLSRSRHPRPGVEIDLFS